VQLSPHDIVQPDLIVLLKGTAAKVTPSRIMGPPDVVIEILSSSTAENDQHLKRSLYQQAGVREYWIVNPDSHHILQLELRDGSYIEHPGTETARRLAVLPAIEISLDQVW
jgi:Uma2 family endonuclease